MSATLTEWPVSNLQPVLDLMRRDGKGDLVEAGLAASQRVDDAEANPAEPWLTAAAWARDLLGHNATDPSARLRNLGDTTGGENGERIRRSLTDLGFHEVLGRTPLWPGPRTFFGIEALDDLPHVMEWVSYWTSADGPLAEICERTTDPASYEKVLHVHIHYNALLPTAPVPRYDYDAETFHYTRGYGISETYSSASRAPGGPVAWMEGVPRSFPGGPDGLGGRLYVGSMSCADGLATRITVLRAAAQLITPWIVPAITVAGGVMHGRGGSGDEWFSNTHRIVGLLPQDVLDRFGQMAPTNPAGPFADIYARSTGAA